MVSTRQPSFFSDEQWVQAQALPLGVHQEVGKTIFIAFSDHATRIELSLLDSLGVNQKHCTDLEGPFNGRWYAQLQGLESGQVYGYRVHGANQPAQGHCFDANRLLLDPAAKDIIGLSTANLRVASANNQPLARIPTRLMPLQPRPSRLRRNRAQAVIYEVHVKGFTQQLESLETSLRGTYAGFASDQAIAHLKAIGVNTVCLLPIQAHMTEAGVDQRGLPNYWGYNTIGFNFPDPRCAVSPADPAAVRQEFLTMVQRLHEHDIDVVLDVVYNHTAEAGVDGPVLAFRGFDNASWYRGAVNEQTQQWQDFNDSGCGNTLNYSHPEVRQFVLDSLRYWVEFYQIDGFRFDLASVMGRNPIAFETYAPFFRELLADPLLSQVQLIAEPWDAGAGGYQLSEFPAPFLEWNDRYRDCIRRFWLGGSVTRGEFAQRFAGSSDIFAEQDRGPTASINFVAVHDGFTLADTCSYNQKNNLANGEQNRDGRDGELCRAFGPAQSQVVVRAMLATLLLSQGTPMLAAGDELGKTQNGNNNAYCQDNAVSWLNWAQANHALIRFVSFVLRLRQEFSLLRHPRWFAEEKIRSPSNTCEPILIWRDSRGLPITANDWHDPATQALAIVFDGGPSQTRFVLLVNPAQTASSFMLPQDLPQPYEWQLCLDTANQIMRWPQKDSSNPILGKQLICSPQSLMLLYQLPETN